MALAEVTLNEVALKSGVSIATASRALNGRDGVRPEVRERIKIVANALGYQPNRAAQNLAGGKTSVIGLVVGREGLVGNHYMTALVQAVARAADAHDEGLMLIMDIDQPNESVQKVLNHGLIDGLVMCAVALRDEWVEELLGASMPVVIVGGHPWRSDVWVVGTEHVESAAALVGHMLDTGCERVATLTGPLDLVDASRRLDGYRLAHQRRGLEVDESLVFVGDFQRDSAYLRAREILNARPDGIFAANDFSAVGLLRGIVEAGLSIPGDISLAGFDGLAKIGGWDEGSDLSSAEQDFPVLADTAVSTLLELVNGQSPTREQLIEPRLHFGATTHTR